ncbi:MAG: S-layer homology domain-containing protein [Clostridia bacterium]|nr:S-layer homology domain-containing protein [Clostridia bacterium]
MRKITLRTLALLLVFSLWTVMLPVSAAKEGDSIPLLNAGFEEATESENPGWSYISDHKNTIDTSYSKSGKNSLKIDNIPNRQCWAAQTVYVDKAGLIPGAMYEVGAWISTDLTTIGGAGAGFKIEMYRADGSGIAGTDTANTKGINFNTLRQWNYASHFFQLHPETGYIKIYIRTYGEGVAWYDDVTLKLSGGPEPYSYFADHVFHYPDEKEGNAYVYLDSYYAEDSEEAKSVMGRFTFYDVDGVTVLDKKENVKFSNGEMKYTYPVSLMKEKQVQYQLKTELVNGNGETINEWMENLYVYDRSLWMPDKRMIINGERFDPVIAYHADIPSYEEISAGGFTAVQTGVGATVDKAVRDKYMAALEANGLKGLFVLYPDMKPAAHPDVVHFTKEIVNELKDDPRIFAWAVMDEPLGAGVTPEKKKMLEESYRIIRDIDPNHPVYLVDYNNHKESAKYCDVFFADTYASSEDTAKIVSDINEPLARQITRTAVNELAASYKSQQGMPSLKTMRGSVLRGFEAGNSYGTGFYSIDDAIGHIPGEEKAALYTLDIWEDFTKILLEDAPILFDYYAGYEGKDYTVLNEYKEGNPCEELLWRTWFTDEGEMYLLAHNRSSETADFNIPLASANGKVRVGAYTAKPIGITATGEKTGENTISFTLEQEEAALYKITPSEKVDLSLIDAPAFDDIDGDYAWAKDAILTMQGHGVVNAKGENTFAPGEAITRGDFAGFLVRTLGFTSDSTENFSDVPAEREYAKEIATGKAIGVLNGIGENLFNPEAAITRQDMMTICARGMKMAEKLSAADASVLDAFHDKANVADYALESVSSMIASGIIKGDDAGYLNPTGNTRRAEAAVIMQRILHAEKVAVTPEGEAVTPSTPSEPEIPKEVIEFAAPSEEALAKYNRSIDLLKGLGTPAITPETSITNGEAEAAVSAAIGMGFDAFGENHKALTTAKAVEEIVKLLGYEVYAQRDGGFMGTAARIDLIRGMDVSSEYLRGGEFALLLENALGIYLADPTSYGESADGRYVESEDTLLTRFRHLTLYKGVLEQNENTGLARGKVAVGTNLLDVGDSDAKNFIGQKVEAYTEGEDNKIVYIRANKNVKTTTVDAEKIDPGQTDMGRLVYEDENGHTKSITISGAQVLYNGKYKTNADVNTITPAQGAVTLIENGGSGADYILVEKYSNFIVDSVFAEENKIFFKNRPELIWDVNDTSKRLSMQGGRFDTLTEWTVLSLYESEDGKVIRAIVSTKTATGKIVEISDEDVTVGETVFSLAEDVFGTISLGEEYTLLQDASGKIAGVNDEMIKKEYVYYTTMAKGKGMDGKVSLRIFTKDNVMEVKEVKDPVMYNGSPIPAAQLLEKPALMSGTTPIGQLMVIEREGDFISSIETAKNGTKMTETERLSVFSYDVEIPDRAHDTDAKRLYQGFDARILAGKYLVDSGIVYFVVPEKYSAKDSDYHAYGWSKFKHDDTFVNSVIYDIDENYSIGAIVQTVPNFVEAGVTGIGAVVVGKGKEMNADGEVVTTLRVRRHDETVLKFQSDDFEVVFGSAVMTSFPGGDPQHKTGWGQSNTPKDTIRPDDLNVGDVILYSVKSGTNDVVTSMRVLYRAGYGAKGEISQEGMGPNYNYSQLTYACGKVEKVLDRAFTMTPGQWERLFVFAGNGEQAPIVLVEDGEVKKATKQHMRVGDTVYVQKYNPYTEIIVIYR